MYYGYNRVSSKEQHEDRGNTTIRNFCAEHGFKLEKIYVDKQTGRNFERIRYTVLKEDVLRAGDCVIIPEYDRFGRADETKAELEFFKANDIRVIFVDIPTTHIDLSKMENGMAKMILGCINDMLISFYDCLARTELERKQKRQREGYEELRKRGEWDKLGRPRVMTLDEFAKFYQAVEDGEKRTSELQKELGMNPNTYYKYVREYRKTHGEKEVKE